MNRTADTRPTSGTGDITGPVRILLDIPHAARLLSVGRTTMYELLKIGEIESVKIGALRRVPLAALHSYLATKTTEYQRIA